MIIEGTAEKVLQFIFKKTLVSFNKMFFSNTKERFKQENFNQNYIFLSKNNISVHLFTAAPYRLMLVLHTDALFHYNSSA